ncbi:PPE family protein [Mycobacterium botniense]|uniref:PPE family protein n=1 Tax=Mycobacterium botniense TaxID=84962 RepID=A0A7I9Y361_9MYCO|nr:PPE family protein [Mycobacterium botniense]GFG76516.1 PPE family protein [Mycobacterium botniense]
MDFGALPPEINSARMYSGPGSGPLLAAATAWDGLANELSFSAGTYSSVIANLTSTGWRGAASTMMAGAVAPYVAWLHDTAARAAQTAAQAKAAVGAYETAFAATVPPPLIEANRAQLAALAASNFFGQNSPAIAATEAEYDEMWAQDAAAMYGYAGSSASATRLTPFSQPPRTTDPAGQAAQAAAVAQATATGAGHARNVTALSGLTSALQSLASPASASSASSSSANVVPVIAGEPVTAYGFETLTLANMAEATNDEFWRLTALGARLTSWYSSAQRDFAQGIGPFAPIFGIPLPSTTSAASAVMGRASQVSLLSVPPTWAATAAPEITPAALTLPAAGTAPDAAVGIPGGVFGETLMGSLAGRAVSAAAAKPRRKVIPRSPAGG